MVNDIKTLADTLKDYGTLPVYLQFIEDPNLIKNGDKDTMYENIYTENYIQCRLRESKGTRQLMGPYFRDTEEPSWEDFINQYADSANELNITKPLFNKELSIYQQGKYSPQYYKNSGGISGNDTEPEEEFNPDDPNANPILKKLYSVSNAAKNQTESVEDSVNRKYKKVFDTARNIANAASLNCHAFICGEAGVGKTYSVKKAVEVGLSQWHPNKRHQEKPESVYVSGSIGNSITDLVTFFFKNRFQKIIILDDADGFFLSNDQNIQNFLKRILDPDFQTVTIPSEIRKRANNTIESEAQAQQEKKQESLKISVDMKHLNENKCSVDINGFSIPFTVNENDKNKLKETFDPKQAADKIYSKVRNDNSNPTDDDLNVELLDTPSFEFNSDVIAISNLSLDDMNEAVISRCDQEELKLTTAEFMCRAEMILPELKMGIYSSVDRDVIEWAKKEAFAIFKILVLEGRKYKGLNFPINVHLDFRFLNKVTNRMIIRINDYCIDNNLDPRDRAVRPQIENAVQDDFIRDLLALLAMGGKKKRI